MVLFFRILFFLMDEIDFTPFWPVNCENKYPLFYNKLFFLSFRLTAK